MRKNIIVLAFSISQTFSNSNYFLSFSVLSNHNVVINDSLHS